MRFKILLFSIKLCEVGDFLLKLLFEVKGTNFMSNYINTKFTYLSIFQYSGGGMDLIQSMSSLLGILIENQLDFDLLLRQGRRYTLAWWWVAVSSKQIPILFPGPKLATAIF